jgi:transcriptional regulator with XRE-family HTH domain
VHVDADNEPALEIGRLLSRVRRTAGLTQEEVAERAEMSVRALRNIELGLVPRPRRRTMESLVQALRMEGGDENELLRLARASRIAKSSEEDSFEGPAPQRPCPAVNSLPTVVSPFVGRDGLLTEITASLTDPATEPGPVPSPMGRSS